MQEVKNSWNQKSKEVWDKQWGVFSLTYGEEEKIWNRDESCFTMSWSKHNEHVDEYKSRNQNFLINNKKNRSSTNLANNFWRDRYESHLAVKQ